MIEAIATVVKSQSGWVTIEAFSRSSCDHCQQSDCGSSQTYKALPKRYHRLTLPYHESVSEGTQVIVALPEKGLLTASALMFALPLICILLGAIAGQWLNTLVMSPSEWIAIIMSILGGFIGFHVSKRWHRKLHGAHWLEPTIIRQLLPIQSNSTC